jgi:hypothetical protein
MFKIFSEVTPRVRWIFTDISEEFGVPHLEGRIGKNFKT